MIVMYGKWEKSGWKKNEKKEAEKWDSAKWKDPKLAREWFEAGWRDAKVAKTWLEAGWSKNLKIAKTWFDKGWKDPKIAKYWIESGWKDPIEANKWLNDRIWTPKDALEWQQKNFDVESAKKWRLRFSKDVDEAWKWYSVGWGDYAREASFWNRNGWIDPRKALDWFTQGWNKSGPTENSVWKSDPSGALEYAKEFKDPEEAAENFNKMMAYNNWFKAGWDKNNISSIDSWYNAAGKYWREQPEEAKKWLEKGWTDPEDAAKWRKKFFDEEEASKYKNAGFTDAAIALKWCSKFCCIGGDEAVKLASKCVQAGWNDPELAYKWYDFVKEDAKVARQWLEAGWKDSYYAFDYYKAKIGNEKWDNIKEALNWYKAGWRKFLYEGEDALRWKIYGWKDAKKSLHWAEFGWVESDVAVKWHKAGWKDSDAKAALEWYGGYWRAHNDYREDTLKDKDMENYAKKALEWYKSEWPAIQSSYWSGDQKKYFSGYSFFAWQHFDWKVKDALEWQKYWVDSPEEASIYHNAGWKNPELAKKWFDAGWGDKKAKEALKAYDKNKDADPKDAFNSANKK